MRLSPPEDPRPAFVSMPHCIKGGILDRSEAMPGHLCRTADAPVSSSAMPWRPHPPGPEDREGQMNFKLYHDTVDRMQKADVDPEYVQGWAGGFMGNPKREEQRITEAYEAGYAAGESGETDGFDRWRTRS